MAFAPSTTLNLKKPGADTNFTIARLHALVEPSILNCDHPSASSVPANIRQESSMKSCLQSLFAVRAYLLSGALLIMAGSLLAASGIYSFTLNSIDGKPAPLADSKGKVVLVVNVASAGG